MCVSMLFDKCPLCTEVTGLGCEEERKLSVRVGGSSIPNRNSPMSNSVHPARKVKRITKSTGRSLVYSSTRKAINDVGPMETSFIVPKIM